MSKNETQPLVGIIMGSKSDWSTMSEAANLLEALQIPFLGLPDMQQNLELEDLLDPIAPDYAQRSLLG